MRMIEKRKDEIYYIWSICEGNEKHMCNVRKPEGKQLLGITRHGWLTLQFMDGADWILTTLGSAQ